MIQTGFESRVKIQDIISNQLPNYILDESPLTSDFLKQYYISQEYQSGAVDLADNLDQYLRLDNLTPDVVVDSTTLSEKISSTDTTITVSNTKGFPNTYGLLKIDNEIITYTDKTSTTFTGCERGFSGITSYHQDLNEEDLVFSTSNAAEHEKDANIQNLSSLFLKEFYKKTKKTFTPGLENINFDPEVDAGNFIREARSLYQTKGTNESFRILFNVLYNETPNILNLEDNLIKPSTARYVKRRIAIGQIISGNPLKLKGQSVFKSNLNTDINISVSEVEPFTRIGIGTYYSFGLFIDNSGSNEISNTFDIIPNTKVIGDIPINSSVITVDSTVGFSTSGVLVSGDNKINYTHKTLNQFLGVTSVTSPIETMDDIRSDQYYYGYENGDINKEVRLRFTGVLSEFTQDNTLSVNDGDIIGVKNIGDKVKNNNKNYKEIFANSWIYNTSSTTKLEYLSNGAASANLMSPVDRSSLKFGDRVEFIDSTNKKVIYPTPGKAFPYVSKKLQNGQKGIDLDELDEFKITENDNFSLRRKLKTANSSSTPIEFGNDKITSDVQNVYFGDDYAYVAANSLPSYSPDATSDNSFPYNEQINVNIRSSILNLSDDPNGLNPESLIDNDPIKALYTTISFTEPHLFENGDKIYYQPTNAPLVGIETGIYFIKKIDDKDIQLYGSRSSIISNQYIPVGKPVSDDGTHKFTLYSQRSGEISPQKLLKKFPLSSNIYNGESTPTTTGGTGMLINGVEINNYKSSHKMYYGPLDDVLVVNGGDNFDVVNPPNITVPNLSGTTALVQPVLSGKIDKVFLSNQDYDIESVVSIGISGGNGTGYNLEPVLKVRSREVSFNARPTTFGGGINTTPNTSNTGKITFLSNHNFTTGQSVKYECSTSSLVGVGVGGNETLANFGNYYARVMNSTTIKLYNTFDDSIFGNTGINTIQFNGEGSGIQKFTSDPKMTVDDIRVLDGGRNYTNRKLLVKPTGISTYTDTIIFKDHGFNSGELISYSAVDGNSAKIEGLDTTNIQYYVLKTDDDNFRLCNAGVGGTNRTNYENKNIEFLGSTGTGYQQFSYPEIKGFVKIISTTGQEADIPITPSVKGSIIDVYVYEGGTGYGSTIANNEVNPLITIKTGVNAILTPYFNNGRLFSVDVEYGGKDYYSIPDLQVIDPTGKGVGAELKPIIENLKITGVEISNAGIGYSSSSTISVKSAGQNAKLIPQVRSLTINNKVKFGGDSPYYQLVETDNKLKYAAYAYNSTLFDDDGNKSSGIIGWAYDGNPIYGPYGLGDPSESPSDTSGLARKLKSGYVLNTDNVIDRPLKSDFEEGYFIEDYKFDNSGDLDKFNGRFEKNKEFPNGVYAYHATINEFPYFIGNEYRSLPITENITTFDQSTFDFNTSGVLRNTLPYKVSDKFADNDFIIETNEIQEQEIEIQSVSSGSITGYDVLNVGSDYITNETLEFDESGTKGDSFSAKVGSIKGKDISVIETTVDTYDDSLLIWGEDTLECFIEPNHPLKDGDRVVISGLSSDLSNINGSYKIGITTFSSTAISTIFSSPTPGFTTEIYVSAIPESISIGSSILVGPETLKILNIFGNDNILRIERDSTNNASEYPAGIGITYITNSFKINKETDYFNSSRKKSIYFNPTKSVGIGTTPGTNYEVSFDFAGNSVTRNIPVRQLYIENHPFKTNQKISLTIPSGNIAISTNKVDPPFNIPTSLYVVNKGINTLGIKTGIGTASDGYEYEEVYFRSLTNADTDKYLLQSDDIVQVTSKVQRIKSVVSVSTVGTFNSGYHELSNGDDIILKVEPNINSGIGSDTNIEVKRDLSSGKILINPITFNVGDVNINDNTITLGSKGFNLKTGDKVLYSGSAAGLSTGNYYVYKVDDKIVKLCKTYSEATQEIPNVIDITSVGISGQSISLINPPIKYTNNTNLVFDHSDSSMNGYDFKVYYDQEFKNPFVGTGNTSSFNVSTTSNTTTLTYSDNLSKKLYYNIEKSGFISTSDTDVLNYSEILSINSVYDGEYIISGVGQTNFTIFLNEIPERTTYQATECDVIEYTTKSKSAKGPINKIKIISGGSGYKNLPTFVGVGTTSTGKDASIILKSDSMGNVSKVRFINAGFEYSSDKTLEPIAYVSPIIELKNSKSVGIVTVISGGENYLSAPKIVIIDSDTKEVINSGLLEAELLDTSIFEVNVAEKPYGLPEQTVTLKTSNNTNGITISRVDSPGTSNGPSNPSEFLLTLVTPTTNFGTAPFKLNDEIFVEGIEKYGTDGTGCNSTDLGYEFLKVTEIIGSSENPNPFKFRVSAAGISTGVGVAVTIPTQFTSVVNKSDYPTFSVVQSKEDFDIGETLIVNDVITNIKITQNNQTSVKVSGLNVDDLSVDDVIVGNTSGNKGTIKKITENNGKYDVGFSHIKDIGWFDEIGKLNDDTQVTPNNDYYQNLSYSVQSSITWDKLQTQVNNILHTSGLKNFADTGITSTSSISIGSTSETSIIRDYISEKRVDEIKGLDLVRDIDITGNVARLIEFKNLRLSDYISCLTNDVFVIDNINSQFSNLEDSETYYTDIMEIPADGRYTNLLVRISDNNRITGISTQIQLSELVLMNSYAYSTNNQNTLLEKYRVFNSDVDGYVSIEEDQLGSFIIEKNDNNINVLRFYPKDKFDTDYNLKILTGRFTTVNSGVSTIKVGSIDKSVFVQTVPTGNTDLIVEVGIDSISSLFANSQIIDVSTGEMNFVESYITQDGQHSFISEAYNDTNPVATSDNKIGILTSTLSGNVLSLKYENNTSSDVIIKSNVVGFGSTGFITPEGHTGVGTYRFKSIDEPDGYERSIIYQGISTSGVGKTTIVDISSNLFDSAKSIVEVSVGSSKAVHEVLSVHDTNNIFVQPAKFISGVVSPIGNTGLGTFGGEYEGGNLVVSFYPDDEVGMTTVSIFNECLYTGVDALNIPQTLFYGNVYNEKLGYKYYNGISGDRINRRDFKLNTNSIPIYAKSFNPNSSILDADTGTFNIDNHFFRTGEELVYTPKSTIIGIGSTPVMYRDISAGITSTLPSTVFGIKKTDNSFQIATTRANANAGTAITFTGFGEGNAHTLSMKDPNERSLITIDDIVQYPVTPSPISHTLKYNHNVHIGLNNTIFSLSGISTIHVEDVLKIDNEYMRVIDVGTGSSSIGPITPGIGTYPLVSVERGSVGTAKSIHENGDQVNKFKGGFNIVDSTIYFTNAPRGNPNRSLTDGGLDFPTSEFTGRTFLRNNYSTNDIYDDVSDQFNGITTQFTLTVGGANTIGIGTTGGNGILFINGIFQTPTTDNNPRNNFKIIETGSGATGVTSVIFSGITSTNGELIISDSDVNRNGIPRGGIPISYGSTTGSGYAPLVGALVRPVLDNDGTITGIVGVPTAGSPLAVDNAQYDNTSGILTVTTFEEHQLVNGGVSVDEVKLMRLEFSCPAGHEGITTTFFPSGVYGDRFSVISVGATNEFTVNVGTSTIPHTYVGSGTAFPYYGDLKLGSGYNSIVSIGVSVIDDGYDHRFVSAENNSIIKTTWDGTTITPTNATYHPSSGIVTFTVASHGLATDDLVGIKTESLTFKCSKDNYASDHKYPRPPFPHTFDSADANAVNNSLQPTGAAYNPLTGDMVLTFASAHGISNGATITIANNSINFKCSRDGFTTIHSYPRSADPASGSSLTVSNATANSGKDLTVNVGESKTGDHVSGILTAVTKVNNDIFSVFVGSSVGKDATITATPKTYNTHVFDSSNSSLNNALLFGDWTGSTVRTPNNATYAPDTGDLVLSIGSHTFTTSNTVGIKTSSLAFRCNQDDYNSIHKYPRETDPVNGIQTAITAVDQSGGTITVNVGKSNVNTGGALDFTIVGGGKSYTNPVISVSPPSYSNLDVIGVSRLGEGPTTDTGSGLRVTPVVGASQTSGIGSGFFEVSDFEITRTGYGFKSGDVFEPIGLVTDRKLYEPHEKATMQIQNVYFDDFTMWQFGEFDYIDSIENYQDGLRTRFPLYYNGNRISVDADPAFDSDLNNVMLVVINGVIQQPKEAYNFIGGASINFVRPLDKEDKVAIFFYKGTDLEDAVVSTGMTVIVETGDRVQVSGVATGFDNSGNLGVLQQDERIVKYLNTSTSLETNIYTGDGIDEDLFRPINLLKQKEDRIIDSTLVTKKRVSLEPIILPSAKIIGDFTTSDNSFYVDSADLFDYEQPDQQFSGIIVSGKENPSIPSATATINSTETTVTSISVTGGSGYTSVPSVSISAPPEIGVGVGTTATATATISNGTVDTITVTEGGLGYTIAPKVLIEPPSSIEEQLASPAGGITVQTSAGILTGIGTTTVGSSLGIRFVGMSTAGAGVAAFAPLSVGNPLYIYGTQVGTGVTSMNVTGSDTVGIGTSFADNVYTVAEFTTYGSQPNVVGFITCVIKSDTNVVGLASTSTTLSPVGYYSVGKLTNFTRSSSPISLSVTGLTVDVGLTTFPTLQRRGGPGDDTWKQTGGLKTPE